MTDTHERCSELLAPYLRHELEADDARFVEEHLVSCEECRAERRAVEALLAPADFPLTELERSRLHRETWKEIEGDIQPVREPLMPRLAPYLGVAAALVLIAVGIVAYSPTGGEDSVGDAGGGGVSVEDAAVPEEDGADGGDGSAESSGATTDAMMAAPSPLFERRAGAFDVSRLDELGTSGYPFPEFKMAYVEETATADEDQAARNSDTLEQLVSAAGGHRKLVRICASNAVQMRPGSIPVYGAFGTFGGRKVLVIGLVLTEDGQDSGRYSIWVYPRGDCFDPLDVREGRINP